MKDIELRLVTNQGPAVAGIKAVAAEAQKLHTNNEKNNRRQIGLIEDVEKELAKLQEAQKKAMTIEHVTKYNQKIAEAKMALQEYNQAGVKMEKQGNSILQSVGKWALGFASVSTALKLLKDAFAATETGLRTFNKIGAVTKQILYDLVSGAKAEDLIKNIRQSLKANEEAEKLRLRQRLLIVEIAKAESDYNKIRFEAYNRAQSEVERLERMNQVMLAHEVLMDKKVQLAKDELSVIREGLKAAPEKTALLDAEAQKLAELERLEGERFAQTREIESLRTGIEKKLADDLIDINDKRIASEKKAQEDWYMERRDMFFDELDKIEKDQAEARKREAEEAEKTWKFRQDLAKKAFDLNKKNAKEDWDEMIENEEKLKELEEGLREGRVEALKKGLSEVYDFLQTIADRELEDAQRRRDILDTRISEAQSALEAEIELYKAGYAANIGAKQKELAELKRLREAALKDEEKSLLKQRQLESISQGVSLFSATTNILKEFTKLGPIGLALAGGAIAAMFSLLASTRKKITDTTKLAHGGHGMVNGRLHSQGGEAFLNHVEVEDGERWGVLSRSASRKYGKVFGEMVNSFNRDKLPIPKAGIMLNNISVQNEGPNKRLDEVNSNLRQIRSREEIIQLGNKTIIKRGNSTRIIKR